MGKKKIRTAEEKLAKLQGITSDLVDMMAIYMGDEWGDDEVDAYRLAKKAIKELQRD